MLAETLQIVFRDVDHSAALEGRIREEAAKLDRVFDRILGGTITIEEPHRHQHQGRRFDVHIRLAVPGGPDLVVSREPGDLDGHEDPYLTVRDAFAAARRRLVDHVEKQQGKVKNHAPGAEGSQGGA